jgi:hypothetical protein
LPIFTKDQQEKMIPEDLQQSIPDDDKLQGEVPISDEQMMPDIE